jgi:hypothetical protein
MGCIGHDFSKHAGGPPKTSDLKVQTCGAVDLLVEDPDLGALPN